MPDQCDIHTEIPLRKFRSDFVQTERQREEKSSIYSGNGDDGDIIGFLAL